MITNMLQSLEAVAEKGIDEFRAELAKHKQALDDDLTAAIEAAVVLPAWARPMIAKVVTGLVADLAGKDAPPADPAAPAPADAPAAADVPEAPAQDGPAV